MKRKWRSGLAAVAAVIAILAVSMTAMYLMSYIISRNRAAVAAKQEAKVAQAPRVPEVLSAFVYNASLCTLFEGRLAQERMPWKLIVVNSGNVPVEVDSIVFTVGGDVLYRNTERHLLYPGRYISADLMDCGSFCGLYMALGVVQVHTTRGGFFTGGYAVPKPDTIISIDEVGRCIEP